MHGPADRLEHLARRHAAARHLAVDPVDVAAGLLEHLDAAGVDELDAVASGRLQPPRDRVAQLRCDGAAGRHGSARTAPGCCPSGSGTPCRSSACPAARRARAGRPTVVPRPRSRSCTRAANTGNRSRTSTAPARRCRCAADRCARAGATAPYRVRACAPGWPWDRRCGRGCRPRRASPPSRAHRSAARPGRRRPRPCRPSGRGRAARRRRRWRGRESRRP